MKLKCDCPKYCRFCGERMKKDQFGHYCPTENCQWGNKGKGCSCTLNEKESK